MTVSPLNRDFIAGFQRGSYESVRELYHLYYASLIEFAEQLTQQKPAAHNIVLETFVKLFQMRYQFDSMPNIKAFLYITVRNICHTYLHAEKKPDSDAGIEWFANEEENANRFNDDAVRAKAIDALCQEVELLSEKCRRVFTLLFCKRLPVPVVAEELDLDQASVVQQRIKAIQQLRTNLYQKSLFSVPLYIYFLAIACNENC
jgi:RNA polymerase sigma-70 factor (ECF subfamily)